MILKIKLVSDLPFNSQHHCEINGGAEHDIDHWVDEIGIQHCIDHGVKFKSASKSVVGHQKHTKNGVDDSQNYNERIEAVPQFLPGK